MFEGDSSFRSVVISDNITKIGARAFANTDFVELTVYDSVTSIASDAFEGCDHFQVYVTEGSYAAEYFKVRCDSGYFADVTVLPATLSDAFRMYTCEMVDWYADDIQDVFYHGATGTIYDVSTGLSWRCKRWAGGRHADIEPLTAADTAVICEIYGVESADQILENKHWQRRPCLLIVDGVDRLFACSLYGVPHNEAGDTLADNDMTGQVCLHFKNSTTSTKTVPDAGHQAAVLAAYNWWLANYGDE